MCTTTDIGPRVCDNSQLLSHYAIEDAPEHGGDGGPVCAECTIYVG